MTYNSPDPCPVCGSIEVLPDGHCPWCGAKINIKETNHGN